MWRTSKSLRLEPTHLNSSVIVIVFFRFPHLRLLDFRKIKEKDRKEAVELFKSKKGKDILKEIGKRAKVSTTSLAASENNAKGMDILEKFLLDLMQLCPSASSVELP